MGIPYRDLNELPYAAAVAARYGTRHYAEEVTPSVVDDLPRLVSALDEPADPLSICLLHLARMTARHVKVVLGGDGGDELFGGYDRYAADRWLDGYRAVPEAIRNVVANQVLRRLPDQFTFKSVTHKLRWVDLMARKTGGERYSESLQFFWFNEAHRSELYAPGFRDQLLGTRPDACLLDLYAAPNAEEPIDRMMYVDCDVAPPGAVAHHSRPGHHGVQPGVSLAVPRSAVRRVHGPGADVDEDQGPAAALPRAPAGRAVSAARGAAAGRSRDSPRR